MAAPIIIFSVDAIRGRIILNTLRFNGFEAVLQKRTIHAEELIRKNTPPIVILDTKELSPNELDFFRAASPVLSDIALILLADPAAVKSLDLPDIRTELCRTDPLDVDLIISKVTALLDQKRNGAAVQQKNGTEAGNRTTELRMEEEPDDSSESLEEDLKKFLDLE